MVSGGCPLAEHPRSGEDGGACHGLVMPQLWRGVLLGCTRVEAVCSWGFHQVQGAVAEGRPLLDPHLPAHPIARQVSTFVSILSGELSSCCAVLCCAVLCCACCYDIALLGVLCPIVLFRTRSPRRLQLVQPNVHAPAAAHPPAVDKFGRRFLFIEGGLQMAAPQVRPS